MFPLKDFVSTVLNTVGTSKTRVALENATTLLMMDCRSKFARPNSICGWKSINATAQLSGVRSPFSLCFGRLLICNMTMSSFRQHQLRKTVVLRKPKIAIWLAPVFQGAHRVFSRAHDGGRRWYNELAR